MNAHGNRNGKYTKFCLAKGMAAILILALCVGSIGVIRADAASSLARPKYKLLKRQKKSVTLKVSNSKGVTGYRIYLKTGRKGKWKLYDFALHSNKIVIKKLKPGKVYYVKLRAWRTSGRSIRLSGYSRTAKIDKYKKKTAESSPKPTSSPAPTPSPGNAVTASGSAVTVSDATPAPSGPALPMPDATSGPSASAAASGAITVSPAP